MRIENRGKDARIAGRDYHEHHETTLVVQPHHPIAWAVGAWMGMLGCTTMLAWRAMDPAGFAAFMAALAAHKGHA